MPFRGRHAGGDVFRLRPAEQTRPSIDPAPRPEPAQGTQGDRLWQCSEACQQRVDADGDGLHPATERDLNRVAGQTHQHHGRR